MTQVIGEDPNAGGTHVQGVNEDKHALVESVTKSDIEYQSLQKGRAYSITSSYAATANQEVLSIRCDSSNEVFIIEEIIIGGSGACNFDVFFLAAGTPAGSTVTPKNLNSTKGDDAELTCFGNAAVTGITAATTSDIVVYDGISAASAHDIVDMKGAAVLGKNKTLVITALASVTVRVTVLGHFRDKV